MAGLTFSPHNDLWEPDSASLHPLVCHLCHEQFRQPCLLDCYHVFCASCLHGRASHNRLICPLCGYPSAVKGINSLPPEDCLLRFLMDTDTDRRVHCANCDTECSEEDAGVMFYCNTCSQVMCRSCREITHKAKMFTSHEILSMSKRAKEMHPKCSLHDDHYIMFSMEKKSMLCVKCFRDMQVESRMRCIDIETAYAQGCEMLEQAVLTVKELQASARASIVQLRSILEEMRVNLKEEEKSICNLFNSMQEKLAERKKILLKAAQSQHEEKKKALREQLSHLAALLPTLQVHLVTCSAFLGSANKFEFLDMAYQLMERLRRIVKLPHRLQPALSCKINTDFRAEFAHCLEPLLLFGRRKYGSGSGGALSNLLQCNRSMLCGSSSLGGMPQGSVLGPHAASHRHLVTKLPLAEGGNAAFMEHCRNYESSYRMLQTEVQKLKEQVQEMHRDLTKHHSLVNTDTMEEVLERSLHIDQQIASQCTNVQTLRAMFEEIWEETFQRVTNEQEIYEAQLHDLLQLKQENAYLTIIARQIGPYILSIAKVKERLEPRFQEPKEHQDDRTETMLKIYNDSTMSKETQHSDDIDDRWDSNRNKSVLILQSDDVSLKSSDYCWKSKKRSISPAKADLPL